MIRAQSLRALVVAIVILSGSFGCEDSEAEREAKAMADAVPVRLQADGTIRLSKADEAALGLETGALVSGAIDSESTRFGRVVIRAEDEAEVTAPFAAEVQRAPGLDVGTRVAEGELIATLRPIVGAFDRISLRAQRGELSGQIGALVEELHAKQLELERGEKLHDAGLLAADDLLKRRTDVASIKAHLDGLRSSAAAYEPSQSGTFLLKAPFAAIVTEMAAGSGRAAQPGDAIAHLVRSGSRIVDVAVPPDEPEASAYVLEIGERRFPLGAAGKGVVVAADGMRHDRAPLPDAVAPDALPGATVWIGATSSSPTGLIAPESAVVRTPGGAVVFIALADGLIAPKQVAVVAESKGRVVLTSSNEAGLHEGDAVVTRGAAALRGEMLRAELRHQE